MKSCFVHNHVEYENSCPFCNKNYCADCLILVGKRKTVICKSCYNHFSQRIKRANTRRYLLIAAGAYLTISCVYSVFQSLESDIETTILYMISAGLGLYAIVNSVIRLRQFKNWDIVVEYNQPEVN